MVSVAAIASSTFFTSSSDSLPNNPVYGYLPLSITLLQVISSGSMRPVITAASIFDASPEPISALSCPSSMITPPRGSRSPATVLRIVDFPLPLGPISVTIFPGAAARDIFFTISLS